MSSLPTPHPAAAAKRTNKTRHFERLTSFVSCWASSLSRASDAITLALLPVVDDIFDETLLLMPSLDCAESERTSKPLSSKTSGDILFRFCVWCENRNDFMRPMDGMRGGTSNEGMRDGIFNLENDVRLLMASSGFLRPAHLLKYYCPFERNHYYLCNLPWYSTSSTYALVTGCAV